MRYFLAQQDGADLGAVRFDAAGAGLRFMTRGDRVLFYQLRGEGDAAHGVFVAWGEVDRLSHEGETGVAHLKAANSFKRRIPFSELRGDPRRNREATVQEIPAEVFNQVLARSRR